jgi:hypothetical protein
MTSYQTENSGLSRKYDADYCIKGSVIDRCTKRCERWISECQWRLFAPLIDPPIQHSNGARF